MIEITDVGKATCSIHGDVLDVEIRQDEIRIRDCRQCIVNAIRALTENATCTCCRSPVKDTGVQRAGYTIPLCHGCQGKLMRYPDNCPVCMHSYRPLEGCYECGYGFEHGSPDDYLDKCRAVGKWVGLKGEPEMRRGS
jgi:hypothetical protein